MPIPIVYRKSVESAVASYDFTDIIEGTGIVNFYFGYAGSTKVLSTNRFYSGTSYNSETIENSGAFCKEIDLDFDVLINKPITIKGTCVASVPTMITRLNGTIISYVTVYLRKWDGSTETDIASGASAQFTTAATAWKNQSAYLNVPTTSFKKGEYLRATIEGWAQVADDNNILRVGTDPQGVLDATWTSTTIAPTSIIGIPFRIDL